MTEDRTEEDHLAATRRAVIAAALPHVAFDGWTDRTLAHAVEDAGVDAGLSRLAFPRGGVDLALAYHAARDAELAGGPAQRRPARPALPRPGRLRGDAPARAGRRRARGGAARGGAVRAAAPRRRRGAGDLAHRRHHLDRARRREPRLRLVLQAHDAVGGHSPRRCSTGSATTARTPAPPASSSARRIDNVMQFEEVKARIRGNPIAAAMLKGPQALLDRVRAPGGYSRLRSAGVPAPPGLSPGQIREGGQHGARDGTFSPGSRDAGTTATCRSWAPPTTAPGRARWSSTAPAPSRG